MFAVTTIVLAACGGGGGSDTSAEGSEAGGVEATGGDGIEAARGIDPDAKVIRIGSLFDLSGPVALLGVPWHAAVVAGIEQLNESGQLGDWTVELVVRDHANNPADSVAMYEEIKDEVALIFPTFGSVTTAPLLPRFADDDMLAFVAGGATTNFTDHTIWGFSSYRTEAMRVVDHAVETGGDDVVLGIVHDEVDSGADALDGFGAAADALGVEVAQAISVEVAADEFSAVVSQLKDAGATHVCVCIGAGHAGGILGTAASMDYDPQWYGMLPSFIEAVFYGALPPEIWQDDFLWVTGVPYWGEDRPGMDGFVAAYESSSAAEQAPPPQVWGLIGFLQVQQLGAVLEAAIAAGDLTPDGILAGATSVTDFDADGLLLGPVDLLSGGEATTVTRVLSPDAEARSWEVVGEAKPLDW